MSINERPLLERLQRAANAGGYYSDWIQEGLDRIAELDRELSQAASAIEAKGVEIRGLKERVAKLEKALRSKHACCCNDCARAIERLLPDTIVI